MLPKGAVKATKENQDRINKIMEVFSDGNCTIEDAIEVLGYVEKRIISTSKVGRCEEVDFND